MLYKKTKSFLLLQHAQKQNCCPRKKHTVLESSVYFLNTDGMPCEPMHSSSNGSTSTIIKESKQATAETEIKSKKSTHEVGVNIMFMTGVGTECGDQEPFVHGML